MKNSVRKITAWALTLIMVLSSSPVGSLASVFTTTTTGSTVVDYSESVQLEEEFYTAKVETRKGESDGYVAVTSFAENPSLEVGGWVEFTEKGAVRGAKAITAESGRRTIGRYDITVKNADGSKWEPEVGSGETVDVQVWLNEPKDLNEGEVLTLLHGGSNGSVVPADFYRNEEGQLTGFSFTADGFSIYVVEGELPNYRLKVNFHQYGNKTTSILVKLADTDNDERYAKVLYDPGAGDIGQSVAFYGWSKT